MLPGSQEQSAADRPLLTQSGQSRRGQIKRFILTILVAVVATGCASSRSIPCQIDPSHTAEVRISVREYLKQELSDSYVYYANDGAIGSKFYGLNADETSCTVYVSPSPVCLENGGCILHGEYIVHFDKSSFEITEMNYIVY
jgi:hypothetical protein